MKKVELYAGTDISEAIEKIKKEAEASNEVCYADFNGKRILSTDTEDEAFMKIVGRTKAEQKKHEQEWLDEYHRKEEDFKEKIPLLSKEYKEKARGLVIKSKLDYWDKIVPIRLGDLYHGMELDQVLTACDIMRDDELSYDQRIRKAYKFFMDSGHSGMSAGLTAAMFREFVPDGEDLADAVMNFRFENDKKVKDEQRV